MWQLAIFALTVAAAPVGEESEAAAGRARAALAERLEISTEAIEVLEVEPADWPNAALGCPQKGQVYAQVLMSGYRVQLGHADRRHWLHVAGTNVVDCDKTTAWGSRRSLVEAMAQATRGARRDLAARLGIEEAAVEAKRVRPITDPADLDGCPAAPQVSPDEGGTLLLTLRAQGTTYRYRSDRGTLTYCGPS